MNLKMGYEFNYTGNNQIRCGQYPKTPSSCFSVELDDNEYIYSCLACDTNTYSEGMFSTLLN